MTINSFSQTKPKNISFDFYGHSFSFPYDSSIDIPFGNRADNTTVQSFYDNINRGKYQPIIQSLLSFKEAYELNDWIFYQLVRKTAQQLAPKATNYERYTLYKWFLLGKSGYNVNLALNDSELLFYVQSDEQVFDIPYYVSGGKQFVCLNIHDYANFNYTRKAFSTLAVTIPEGQKTFSYKVTQMPELTSTDYIEKDIEFSYRHQPYRFKIKVNPEVQTMFKNYPVVDYASYFNIPMSKETYSSLIPVLKKTVEGMKQQKGVDFLMRFTRNAFLYETDSQIFGKEKRMSPEQTLMNQYSDCDDRAALFFYLVKEVYNLPMIAVLYPTHITIAVKFDKPVGESIDYNGERYSLCEPTPQEQDLRLGQVSHQLKHKGYEIAYQYNPTSR
ncbi:MAG: hypothetical protein JST82_04930 [Bacteroidetes bacterium]|nr:hypothetical protein [Bacteroidota bacterium]